MAAGSSGLFRMASRAATASSRPANENRNVRSQGGCGISLKLTTAMAASVPNEPIINLLISNPATFFTTMPPDSTSLPSRVANSIPITMSRAAAVPPHKPADGRGLGKRRIQWNHLMLLGQQAAQVAVGDAGFHADGQVAWLVFADAAHGGGGDRHIGWRPRAAHQPLGEMPPQLDRLAAGGRPAHGLGEFLRTLRPHDISRVIRHSSRRTGGAECSEER